MSTIKVPPFSRRISVRSEYPSTAGLTAWHVRDFVRAMDEAGIPDDAPIDDHHANDTRHLTGLSTFKDEDVAS